MSTKKYANAQNILDTLISIWNLKGYKALADYIGVPYQTLMAWKKRGNIGDYAPFMDKGISRTWLETGVGEIHRSPAKTIVVEAHEQLGQVTPDVVINAGLEAYAEILKRIPSNVAREMIVKAVNEAEGFSRTHSGGKAVANEVSPDTKKGATTTTK